MMVTVMVTNETLNNSNGDKIEKDRKREKSVSQNAVKMVVEMCDEWKGTKANKQSDDGRTNERNDGQRKQGKCLYSRLPRFLSPERLMVLLSSPLVAFNARRPSRISSGSLIGLVNELRRRSRL